MKQILLTLHEELAVFAAQTEWLQHIVRFIDAVGDIPPPPAASLFDDELPPVEVVYILPIKTAGALDKILEQHLTAPIIIVLAHYGLMKPYQSKTPPHVAIYTETQAKARLPKTLTILHQLKRDAFLMALRAWPTLRDMYQYSNMAPDMETLKQLLLPEEVAQIFTSGVHSGLMSGDDYGLLCLETEKAWSQYQRTPHDLELSRKAQRLSCAKIRCKQGNMRMFCV